MKTPVFMPVSEEHLPAIHEIYNYYVIHSTATFHTAPITLEEMRSLVIPKSPLYCTYTIQCDDKIVGYVLLTQYKTRAAYNSTAEVTIYLSADYTGKGLGHTALNFIEDIARKTGFHALVANICHENTQSVMLFERCGYERCAYYREVGYKFDRYLDLVSYEKLL